jgi:2-polyprenyl-3-methyl-5-hydroxy-6-metoxy-1,4-benzoquinol methylase
MNPPFIILQGSSRSWAGGRDYCVSDLEGKPVVGHTLKRIRENFPESRITIAAPAFDRGGLFDRIVAESNDPRLNVFYGYDGSPLKRMIAACGALDDDGIVLKVDALHFVFDAELSKDMLVQASEGKLDCVKPKDDFPAQLSSEVYRFGALREIAAQITDEERNFEIHPKFYFFKERKYKSQYARMKPTYREDFLQFCREKYSSIYAERYEVTKLALPLGDMITFHYRHATKFLERNMKILDIACGNGFGSKLVSPFVSQVVGADLNPEIVITAQSVNPGENISYVVDDITSMRFAPETFDAVLTFETFEHVDTTRMMTEIRRVLKTGGLLIMSTPQSCLGKIPICSQHLREYSLEELIASVSCFFQIEHVDGIKAGTICFDGDPIGSNTFLVARKSELHNTDGSA